MWANTVVSLGQSLMLPVSLAKPVPAGGLTVYLTSSDPVQSHRDAERVHSSRKDISQHTASSDRSEPGDREHHGDGVGLHSGHPVRARDRHVGFARCCQTITGTATQSAVLNLSAPAPSGGLTVNLFSDNTKVATVPATVTFAAHATTVNVPITGVAAGAAVIHASALPDLVDTSTKVTVR